MLRSDQTEIVILHETRAFDTQLSFSYLVQSILKMIIIGELEPDKVNAAIILARKNVEQFQIDSVPIRVELQFRSTHGSQSSYDIYAVAVNGQKEQTNLTSHTTLKHLLPSMDRIKTFSMAVTGDRWTERKRH